MSQFPGPAGTYSDPYGQALAEPRKTSGLAIAALVSSLIFCCPLTTVLGVILGAIGLITIRSDSQKGRGLAIAAILLGIVFTVGQVLGGLWFYRTFMKPVLDGPREALVAGFAGDYPRFQGEFHGAGATAPQDEARQFIDELRNRYGEFVSVRFDEQAGQSASGQPGQPEAPFPYVITFKNQSVKATTVIVFFDQATNVMVFKLKSIVVHDPTLGDLSYPPGAATTQPTTGPSTQQAPSGDSN